MATIAENKTVREMLMSPVWAHLKEMDKKGLLPKGK